MHFQDQRGLFADRARVVIDRRLVGGADLAQLRAARFQNFANSKSAADLDQLAARNDDFVLRDLRT